MTTLMKLHTSGQGSLVMARHIKTRLPCSVVVNDDGLLSIPLALFANIPASWIVGTYDRKATITTIRADLIERAKMLPKTPVAYRYEHFLKLRNRTRTRNAARG